ncbi:hypothetical protein Mal64_38910 [Pseudobythopirellula maris]|uniref:Tetratricopeptide repeat protein n=1 Tax=Pseudobythopirellula maris TaxID=2527991 RepID=A0A5C5ZH05_9BACT|nr:hypothetical protein [Pseudobythopirellula maris]TWT86151.1 hypothetical protein Mal64_38910 [Pseudobythopirellula maris]
MRLAIAGLLLVAIVAAGCEQRTPRRGPGAGSAHRTAAQRVSQSNALFDAIVGQLRNLPEAAQLELRPPVVVLNSRNSADREDVLAVAAPNPRVENSPVNLIGVPTQNARFRSAGVQPGDIVKYYVLLDRESRERLQEAGEADIVTMEAIDLTVAQVLSEAALIVENALPQPIGPPGFKLEVWRNIDDRMDDISTRLAAYANRRDPPLGWQPAPDDQAIGQLTERLNQWMRQLPEDEADTWERPALLATLPADVAGSEHLAPRLSDEALSGRLFQPHETRVLEGLVWARDLAGWVAADQLQPLGQAEALFDWVVRNVQLVEETPPQFAWETLLHGRGAADSRLEVFALLCRQLNLPVVAVAAEGAPPLAGVLIADEVYLFDPTLGLPIAGEEGGVATLAAAASNDGLLRQLDLDDEPYPLTAEALADAELLVVADPFALTMRAGRFAKKLPASDTIVATVDADALAERLAAAAGERPVGLWAPPFEVIHRKHTVGPPARAQAVRAFLPYAWRPALWKARAMHFRGKLIAAGATSSDALDDGANDHRDAMRLYMDPSVRPTTSELDRLESDEKRRIYFSAKLTATLQLALLSYDEGDPENAIRWLGNSALDAPEAASHADAVRYNLARAHEALGDSAKAAELLEASDSPQSHGDKLRARRLRGD